MADAKPLPELEALRRRLADEEASYAQALAELDQKAAAALPGETAADTRELLRELNELWTPATGPRASGLTAGLARRAWDALTPALERQARFNAVLVRLLNAQREQTAAHHARLGELAAALVGYAQRVEPVVDARDDVRIACAPTEAHQQLEIFRRRLEQTDERLAGLVALRDRIEALSEEVRGLHAGQCHRNLNYATRPRPRIVAVSLFPIASRALRAYRAINRAQFRGLQSFLLHPASSANKSSIVSRRMSVVISPPRTATTGGRGT